jgi:thiamine-monophosphate kinase
MRGVTVGIGDDAAVVACGGSTLLTTDTQREGVHFRREWLSPRELGRRALRVAVSDIAAMGGTPRYVLLSFGAPARLDARWARSVIAGLVAEAARCGAVLVGGNVARDEKVSLVVTIVGAVVHGPLLRSGARAGDTLWVSGPLGDAAAGVELLAGGARRGRLVAAYRTPPLRLELAQAIARRKLATAMIDVSDGLVHDLGHLCRASDVRVRLDPVAVPVSTELSRAARPRSISKRGRRRTDGFGVRLARGASAYALGGGDAYELLFTVGNDVSDATVLRLCAKYGAAAARIGVVETARRGPRVIDPAGRAIEAAGYTHFRGRR